MTTLGGINIISLSFFLSFFVLTGAQPGNERPSPIDPVFIETASELVNSNDLAFQLGVDRVSRLLAKVSRRGGCNVGICFALDGSASISPEEYSVQKEFVKFLATVASIDYESDFSAVQYGLGNIGISETTTSLESFVSNVDESTLAAAPRTFLSAGLGFCIQDLRRSSRVSGKRIVVLGDGRSNFATGLLEGVVGQVTDEIVFAVGVGFPTDPQSLLLLTGGVRSRVFNVQGYKLMANLAINVALGICRN